ncbi:peroxide stress protein YaaA [Arthrobacter gengyunqii]|uniref:Peroxide stress protein YaaA n=1 Tax=Arthrobacter gengyunqii TaxID=2886940 RepID=A0A9X1S789_9MICC|nr:peroxide stress protein YaaA [Arthrobacter gengyunqii]MCC3269996.1 peroxide stress protein YaaA [Arthrobacter gengyunqii]UOY95080.1 peroxide stress protein YaaA [Arthrobacter gengyunqii]
MLILLPPSEGKTAAVSGPDFDPDKLHFPGLNDARKQVLEAVAQASAAADAHAVLGVGPSLAAEVQRNTVLQDQPCAPAHRIYSGVLYDALGYSTLTPAQQRTADSSVVVISGLWGALGFSDPIPAYRLSMAVKLPETGKLASFWKRHLTPVLNEYAAEQLVVDCRSSTYAAAWAPEPARAAAVNVFQMRNGKRTVVSHFAKHTRGELARHLLTRTGSAPETPEQLLAAAREKWEAELVPATARKPFQLNLMLPGQETAG